MLGKDVSAPHSEHTEFAMNIGSSSSTVVSNTVKIGTAICRIN